MQPPVERSPHYSYFRWSFSPIQVAIDKNRCSTERWSLRSAYRYEVRNCSVCFDLSNDRSSDLVFCSTTLDRADLSPAYNAPMRIWTPDISNVRSCTVPYRRTVALYLLRPEMWAYTLNCPLVRSNGEKTVRLWSLVCLIITNTYFLT